MPDAAAETLQRNRLWLAQSAPSLAAQLTVSVVNTIQFRQRGADCDLFFGEDLALESCHQSLASLLEGQLKLTNGVAMPRTVRSSSDSTAADPAAILRTW